MPNTASLHLAALCFFYPSFRFQAALTSLPPLQYDYTSASATYETLSMFLYLPDRGQAPTKREGAIVCKGISPDEDLPAFSIPLFPSVSPYSDFSSSRQIDLVDSTNAKALATIIADGDRMEGIFRTEEV